jgi:hypothetical protein
VEGQRGGRQAQLLGDHACGEALGTAFDEQAEDFQALLVGQRGKGDGDV